MLRPPNGKIARLPRSVRDQLNARLRDGARGDFLLAWLNALPAVQSVLATHFDGRPLNRQNLLAWKRGAYADWLRQLEARAWLRSLRDDARALRSAAGDSALSACLAGPVTIALGHCLHQVGPAHPRQPARFDSILALAAEVNRLRRSDLAELRLRFDRDRHDPAPAKSSQSKPR